MVKDGNHHQIIVFNRDRALYYPKMDSVYFKPSHPAAYGGHHLLKKATNKSSEDVAKYLKQNPTYRKFKKNETKFRRARIFAGSLSHVFQCDLFDLQKFSRVNRGYRYILLVVCCFSRRVSARPLKNKGAVETANAMRDILTELKNKGLLLERASIGSDLGLELWNKEIDKVYDEFGLHHYALRKPKKASLSEISGRVILEKIYKHMHATGTNKWVDLLKEFVEAKNNRPNKSLGGLSSNEVTWENQMEVFDKLYGDRNEKEVNPLTIGTKVQVALDLMPFHKSFHSYWSDKTFVVIRRNIYAGIYRYTIADDKGDEISGTYYAQELQAYE